jgi:hypothetical protein
LTPGLVRAVRSAFARVGYWFIAVVLRPSRRWFAFNLFGDTLWDVLDSTLRAR